MDLAITLQVDFFARPPMWERKFSAKALQPNGYWGNKTPAPPPVPTRRFPDLHYPNNQGPRIAAVQDTEGTTENISTSFRRKYSSESDRNVASFLEVPELRSKDYSSDQSTSHGSEIDGVHKEVSHDKDPIVRIIIEDSRTFYNLPESRNKANDIAESTSQRPSTDDSNNRGSHAQESFVSEDAANESEDMRRWRASDGADRLRKIKVGEIEDNIELDQVWNLENPVFDPFRTLPEVEPTSSTQLHDSSLPPNSSISAQKKAGVNIPFTRPSPGTYNNSI
ncbi:hypothetical protein RUND412_003831 [Rhizina undulata]